MRKSKKLLSLLVTVIMLFSSVTAAFAIESSYTVKADERISINIDGEPAYVKFVPEKTAIYEFKSDSNGYDPYAIIYDETETVIAEGDDSDESYEFAFEATLFAGKTYYIEVSVYEELSAKVGLTVTTIHIHENLTEYPAVAETCTQNGTTYGLQCNDCGFWLVEIETVAAHHTDENADRICDICGAAAIIASETTSKGVTAVLYNCGDLVVSGSGVFDIYHFDSDVYYRRRDVRKIFVGKDITEIASLLRNDGFEGYIVDEENAVYKSDAANVLYSKDGTKLIDFPDASPVEEYAVPDGVTEISDAAFSGNENLKKVNFPDSLRAIGESAFEDCESLEDVSFPAGLEKIGGWAFYGCSKITNVTVPESVTHLGAYAFSYENIENIETVDGCVYLNDILVNFDSVIFPEVLYVREGTRLFAVSESYTANINTVMIPASLIYSESNFNSFYVKSFVADENSPYYCTDEDGVLFNKDKTVLVRYPTAREGTEYAIPQGVKEIASNAFSNSDITAVTFPDSLEKIGNSAFEFCNLYNIELPSGLKEIGSFAFSGTELKAVVIPESVEKFSYSVFECDYIAFMNPDCEIESVSYNSLIVGYNGSTAEKYANDNGRAFATLGEVSGENHSHIYFPSIITPESCEQDGLYSYSCPCGNTQAYTVTVEKTEHSWMHLGDFVKCMKCGKTQLISDYYNCDCECHEEKNAFEEFFFKIKLFFWKLFRTKEFCYCGTYHW